ncbi:MAG: ATP-dependent sacrificial sulfur transferase LarE [Clostridiales bacterium]
MICPTAELKWQRLLSLLEKYRQGGLALAFSGGVDSSLLVAAARQVLGAQVVAVNFVTPLGTEADLRCVRELAAENHWPMLQINTNVLEISEVRNNTRQRCYYCKGHLYRLLAETAARLGFQHLADGNNREDMISFRPGNLAAEQAGVAHPLAMAELNKAEIRVLAQNIGLANWQRPSAGCLASRFVYDQPLTETALRQVEAGEELLRGLGYGGLRLRVHGDVVRIEVEPAQLPRLVAERELPQRLRDLGYRYVTADLQGLQSGSMDR